MASLIAKWSDCSTTYVTLGTSNLCPTYNDIIAATKSNYIFSPTNTYASNLLVLVSDLNWTSIQNNYYLQITGCDLANTYTITGTFTTNITIKNLGILYVIYDYVANLKCTTSGLSDYMNILPEDFVQEIPNVTFSNFTEVGSISTLKIKTENILSASHYTHLALTTPLISYIVDSEGFVKFTIADMSNTYIALPNELSRLVMIASFDLNGIIYDNIICTSEEDTGDFCISTVYSDGFILSSDSYTSSESVPCIDITSDIDSSSVLGDLSFDFTDTLSGLAELGYIYEFYVRSPSNYTFCDIYKSTSSGNIKLKSTNYLVPYLYNNYYETTFRIIINDSITNIRDYYYLKTSNNDLLYTRTNVYGFTVSEIHNT